MRSGILAKRQHARHLHTAIGKLKTPPKCAACQFAKAKRRLTKPKTTHLKVSENSGNLKKNTLLSGQEVSVDYFICSTLGRLYTGYGKTDDASLYQGGCIFVDNATAWVRVKHQISLTSHETLGAKERFEFACRDYGVIVQSYLLDNGAAFTGKRTNHGFRRRRRSSSQRNCRESNLGRNVNRPNSFATCSNTLARRCRCPALVDGCGSCRDPPQPHALRRLPTLATR
jgi:hypothetical protein